MKTLYVLFLSLLVLLVTACAPTPSQSTSIPAPLDSTDAPTATLLPPTETSAPTLTVPSLPTETSTETPTETPTLAPPPFFTLYGNAPVVAKGAGGMWDDRYTDPGAVLFYDGQFHMFRNGFRSWPATVQIGYVTSPDGYTWTKQGEDPVLRTEQVPYAGVAALASSALVEEDGTWVLYFYTWGGRTYPTTGGIGRATAPSPTGPWTPDAELVLQPGPEGAWDDSHVLTPDVVKTEDGYRMYYSGYDQTGVQHIGLATSSDGIQWEKRAEPVLSPAEGWESGWVHQPRVVQTPEGWVMFYRGTQNGPNMALGLATSDDGVVWERSSLNPLLSAKEMPQARAFWFTSLLYHEGTYFLYWEIGINQITEIYLSTREGPLTNP